MDFTEACAQLVERYTARSEYALEIGARDLSDDQERKACERKLFDFNEGITAAAADLHDSLRTLFSEGRAAMVPPSLFALNKPEIMPYRDKICRIVERLQYLSKLRKD